MGYNPTFAGGRAGQDPSVKRATVLTIHLPSVSPPRPRPAPAQLQSVIGFPISITSHKSAMLAWLVLVLVLVLWRAAVVEMWKYKIPPFKV